MSGPVVKALVSAAMEEAEQHARSISAAVAERLGPPQDAGIGTMPAEFASWCRDKGVEALPARPGSVALFVLENEKLGISALSQMVLDISRLHLRRGQADPTAGYPVATALNHVAKLDPPRSWPDEYKFRFRSLPYDLQTYLARHEAERDKTVRQAQSKAAAAKQALLQQPAKATDGNQSHAAA